MGVITYTDEYTSSIPPSRLFKALVIDAPNLIPKIFPQVVKSIEIIQGDGGIGSIRQINFAEGKDTAYDNIFTKVSLKRLKLPPSQIVSLIFYYRTSQNVIFFKRNIMLVDFLTYLYYIQKVNTLILLEPKLREVLKICTFLFKRQ